MPLGAGRFGLLSGVAEAGALVKIEKQIVSNVATVDFTSLQGSTYKRHMLQWFNTSNADGNDEIRLSFLQSTTVVGPNHRAHWRGRPGAYAETNSTSTSYMKLASNTGLGNGYAYFYNLGDSNYKSYVEGLSTAITGSASGSAYQTGFGSGLRITNDEVDGIRIFADSTNISGTFVLYGISDT